MVSTRAMPAVAATAAPHPTITLLQTSSLSSVVQGELERMILAGELRPGDKLTEMALAARLGVSRGPLREAFRMLDESGLVRTEKNRGVFVRDLPVEEAVEIFDLRAAMDEHVGRRLAVSITPAALKEVRALVEQMEQAVKAKDAQRYHLLNLRFHDRLVELAGNGKLTAIYRKLIKELSLFPQAQPRRRLADADLGRRAPPDRQGDRLGRRRRGRPGDVRPRHRKARSERSRTINDPAADARRASRRRSDDHRQRPPLRPRAPAHRRRLRRRLRARLHRAGGRARPRAVAEGGARDRHLARRRLRRPELHQPQQPVDRHRRSAFGARHLRQLPSSTSHPAPRS
jgi:phosphonate utilization transcriptional regulator